MDRKGTKQSRPDVEIIPAPDDLKRKAGGGRPQSAKAIDSVLADMNRVMEAQKENYSRLVKASVERFHRLADDASMPADRRMRELRSVAHELRGIAGTFGYVLAGRIADSFCDYVAAIDDGGTPNVEVERLHASAISRSIAVEGPLDKTSLAVLEGLRHVIAKSLPKNR